MLTNVCLNKDVLEVAIKDWWDLSPTHIDLSNMNYRFIAYKQYVYGGVTNTLARKNVNLCQTVSPKRFMQCFKKKKDIFMYLTVKYEFLMLYEIWDTYLIYGLCAFPFNCLVKV